MARPPSVCFVAHNALGALMGAEQQHVGGIERQQATMARWLADHDWDVTMVTWDDGNPTPAYAGSVRLVPLCGRYEGLPGIRFAVPRWSSLISALSKADSDIYYYNCGDLALGQIIMWAHKSQRPVIFSVPSDPDCDPAMPALKSFRERALYRYGLKNCEHVIVQSQKQSDMLRRYFSKESTILPMPCSGFLPTQPRQFLSPADKPFQVLWVGRISAEKRVEWLLDIARQLPDIYFKVAGAPNKPSAYSKRIEAQASSLRNLAMLGRVPYEQMAALYHEVDLLCCTSIYEGFPNTFLEAWSAGLPVVSTCDPDGNIEAFKLGKHADSIEMIVKQILELSADSRRLSLMSEKAIAYFLANHPPDIAMHEFCEYFRSIHDIRKATRSF